MGKHGVTNREFSVRPITQKQGSPCLELVIQRDKLESSTEEEEEEEKEEKREEGEEKKSQKKELSQTVREPRKQVKGQ